MRKAISALIGGLIVASCIVPKYEIDDSVGEDDGGGEAGATSTGGNTSGGNAGQGGSATGGAGRGGNATGGNTTGGNTSGGNTTGGNTTGGESGEGGAPSGGSTNGGSTNGGSAGAGAGMGGGGGAGMAGSGGGGMPGCGMGLTLCDGECFNLETDGEHCGDCDTDCATGEVCFQGDCELDCGTLTKCGTSCVNTATDEMHCGGCDRPCLGTCVGGNCDLSCPNNGLRCGANCCAAAPTNGTVNCSGNQCVYGCVTNYNDCNADPAVAECYSRTDVAHCGSQCLDCRQPNATATCTTAGACSNTCIGSALTCAPVAGKPSCGTWDFESATTEGWSIWDMVSGLPTAADGALTTRTLYASSGSRSLAVHFNGTGDDAGTNSRYTIHFKLRLCESGQAIDMSNKVLTFDIRADSDSGTLGFSGSQEAYHYFQLYNGTTSVTGIMDFTMASEDGFQRHQCQVYPDTDPITDIVLLFRVFVPWRGWIYIDNAKIEACNPTLCP